MEEKKLVGNIVKINLGEGCGVEVGSTNETLQTVVGMAHGMMLNISKRSPNSMNEYKDNSTR